VHFDAHVSINPKYAPLSSLKHPNSASCMHLKLHLYTVACLSDKSATAVSDTLNTAHCSPTRIPLCPSEGTIIFISGSRWEQLIEYDAAVSAILQALRCLNWLFFLWISVAVFVTVVVMLFISFIAPSAA
jgi:hypothetical protein